MVKHNFPEHRYKYGKQDRAINLAVFAEMLKKAERMVKEGRHRKHDLLTVQSFLAVLFWSGLRKTEIIGSKAHRYILKPCKAHREAIEKHTEAIPGILKEDIQIKDNSVFIRAVARKRGHREAPLELFLDFPYISLIVRQWKRTEPGKRVWPLTEWNAWQVVKRIEEKSYCHFFRFSRLSEMASNPEMSLLDICNWTGLSSQTVDKYLERSGRFIHSCAQKMRRRYLKQAQMT